MHLEFTDEQDALRDAVRTLLQREWPPSASRSLVETGDRTPVEALSARFAELDWTGLVVPEEDGGLGLGAVELAVVAEELGRAVAPGPLLPTLSQFVPAVKAAGDAEQRRRFLGGVAGGTITGSLAVAEGSSFEPEAVTTTVERDGDDFVVTGEKQFVAEAGHVDELAVVARAAGSAGRAGLTVAVVPSSSCRVTPLRSFDATRQYATVGIEGVRVGGERVLHARESEAAAAAVDATVAEATLAVAVETLGTCQTLLDMTVAYARERRQFDRPIGSFQAVKHKVSDMLLAVERARATAYFAAACLAEGDPRGLEAVSVAKAAAGDAQRVVAQEAIQLHGGIGYTWEHDLHLFVKRAKSGDAVFGTAAEHRQRLAAALTARVAESGAVSRWSDGR